MESAEKIIYDTRLGKVENVKDVPKDPKKDSSKARIKKMIIADPGLLMQIKFTPKSATKKVTTKLFITKYTNTPTPTESPVLEWTMDGKNSSLDLGKDYHFLLPYKDSELLDSTESVSYTIEIQYDDSDLISATGTLSKKSSSAYPDEFDPNHKITKDGEITEVVRTVGEGKNYWIEKGYTTYQTNEYGISSRLAFHSTPEKTSSLDVGIQFKDSDSTNALNGIGVSLYMEKPDNIKILERYFYLPYPRLKDNQSDNDPSKYLIMMGLDRGDYEIGYGLKDPKVISEESIEFKLELN